MTIESLSTSSKSESTDIISIDDSCRDDLPSYVLSNIPEVALEIFSYLNMYDLLNLAMVNKGINRISEDNSLWKKILNEIKHYTQRPLSELPPTMSIKKFLDNLLSEFRPFLLSKEDALEKMQKFFENFDDKVSHSTFMCEFPFSECASSSSISYFNVTMERRQKNFKSKKVSYSVLEKMVGMIGLSVGSDYYLSDKMDSENMRPHIWKRITASYLFSNIERKGEEKNFYQNSLSILEKSLQAEINKRFRREMIPRIILFSSIGLLTDFLVSRISNSNASRMSLGEHFIFIIIMNCILYALKNWF